MTPNWVRIICVVAGLVFCLLFGSFGLFIAFSMARAANGRVGIQIAAASFGLAAVSAYCEAASVLLKGRTGPMPAFSMGHHYTHSDRCACCYGRAGGEWPSIRANGRLAYPERRLPHPARFSQDGDMLWATFGNSGTDGTFPNLRKARFGRAGPLNRGCPTLRGFRRVGRVEMGRKNGKP